MGEVIADHGYESGVCGHDGTVWVKVLVDADGHLQVDGVSVALPSGAATAANQTTMITALQLIDDLRNALDSVGTDELDVNVEASVLPTGAATSANQATEITALQSIQTLVGALHDVGLDELDINIVSQSADVEVKQTTPADLVVAQHQYDGSAWRKSNLLWGYHDIWDEDLGGTATGTSWTKSTSAIPAGELWVLQAASIRNTSDSATTTQIWITRASGAGVFLAHVASRLQYEPLLITGTFVLRAGDTVGVYIGGIAADDVIQAGVVGYKMDIAM